MGDAARALSPRPSQTNLGSVNSSGDGSDIDFSGDESDIGSFNLGGGALAGDVLDNGASRITGGMLGDAEADAEADEGDQDDDAKACLNMFGCF